MCRFKVYVILSIRSDTNPMEFVFIIHTTFYSACLFHFFLSLIQLTLIKVTKMPGTKLGIVN